MERFSRTEMLLGKQKTKKLAQSFVTIVGQGAVGSYVTEALARSGVGHLRLIDYDSIKESNINRTLIADTTTIGKIKVDIARARIEKINPDCIVESMTLFAAEDSLETILTPTPDLVIDAIDAVNPKVQLLVGVKMRAIPIITSMGAALRTDVSKIKCGDLFHTNACPLARIIRKRVRRHGVREGIPCVYSSEKVIEKHANNDSISEEQAYPRGRIRKTLGSLPTIPGIFGLMLAHMAIEILTADS